MTPKKKILTLAAVVVVLAAAFWYGGNAPGLQGWQISSPSQSAASSGPCSSGSSLADLESASTQPDTSSLNFPAPDQSPSQSSPETDASASAPQAPEDPKADTPPASSSSPSASLSSGDSSVPQETDPEPVSLTCTLSIRCDPVLEHMDWLDPDKAELIPADGVILAETQASFQEGETVFDLLQRLTRQEGIHMEASFTPGYNSSYVEGIDNLYEFDCGQQSGWLYRVNGSSPGYSSSQYVLSDGDQVEWLYTCDLGQDVGAAQ